MMKKTTTTGLVAFSALLAFSSATTGPAPVEAARITNRAAASSRRLNEGAEADADTMFLNGPQCVKCCGPPKLKPPVGMGVIREDGTGPPGSGTGPPGSGTGKGGKGGKGSSGTGPAPTGSSPAGSSPSGTGTGTRRLKKANRRLAGRSKAGTAKRELEHKPSKCVECSGDEEMCILTAADFSTLMETGQAVPSRKDPCAADVPPCPSSEALVVRTEFLASDSDLVVSAGYEPTREGGASGTNDGEVIDLTDQEGSCGTMISGTTPARITFFAQATHDATLIDEVGVAEHLEENLGYLAFCGSDEETTADAAAADDTTTAETPLAVSAATAGPGGRKLQEGEEESSSVIGFVPCQGATPYTRTGDCASDVDGAECNLYRGQVCIHCEHDVSKPTCYADGVKMLKKNAARAADPPRIPSVAVVGAQMDSESTGGAGGTGSMDVVGGGGATTSSILGAETRGADGGSNASGLGIGLAVGLSLCAALIVLLAARKNRKAYTRDISFLDEEDMYSVDGDNIHLKPGDSSFDGTEVMSENGTPSPTTRWRKSRPGHVVDEDDSILSGDNRNQQMVPRNLSYGAAPLEAASPHDLARGHSGLDVHECNSAMCEICLSRGANPRFIPSNLEDSYVENEGRLNASDLSYASRTYPMEDTVDF